LILTDSDTRDYLLHRVGEKKLITHRTIITKAFGGNKRAPDFLSTYGNSDIKAYVGFVDLAGFTSSTAGKTASDIADYLNPFLESVIDILTGRGALVDKMIGDEIMFILPETEEDEMFVELIYLGQIVGKLHNFAYKSQEYRYRIGLSYGTVNIYHLNGEGYSEWSAVGEPVHVAKRLNSLEKLSSPDPVIGAFGYSIDGIDSEYVRLKFKTILGIIAGSASSFDHIVEKEPTTLKGIGQVSIAYLLPRKKRIGSEIDLAPKSCTRS